MDSKTNTGADTGTQGLVAALFAHSETWGMVWFGLIFWGSVINAITLQLVPEAPPFLVGWASYATGLALGALAKARGGWL